MGRKLFMQHLAAMYLGLLLGAPQLALLPRHKRRKGSRVDALELYRLVVNGHIVVLGSIGKPLGRQRLLGRRRSGPIVGGRADLDRDPRLIPPRPVAVCGGSAGGVGTQELTVHESRRQRPSQHQGGGSHRRVDLLGLVEEELLGLAAGGSGIAGRGTAGIAGTSGVASPEQKPCSIGTAATRHRAGAAAAHRRSRAECHAGAAHRGVHGPAGNLMRYEA